MNYSTAAKMKSFVVFGEKSRAIHVWSVIVSVWLAITFLGAVHCYFYSRLGAVNKIPFTQSLLWSSIRWCSWIFVTPLVIELVSQLQTKVKPLAVIARQSAAAILLFTLIISVFYFLFDDIAATKYQSDLVFFYDVFLRELPISVIVFCLIALVVNHYVSNPKSVGADDEQNAEKESYFLITNHDTSIRIDYSNIIFIAAAGNYVELHTNAGKYLFRGSMKDVEQRLASEAFIRVHRSYIVSQTKIKSVRNGKNGDYQLELITGQQITISRHFAQQIRQKYAKPLKQALLEFA